MEYGIQARSLYHKEDIKVLERVQKRATKMVYGYGDLNYKDIFEKATDAIDKGKTCYLDFTKAFDKVPHFRLIKKTKGTWSRWKCGKYIFSRLTGRRQRVFINGVSSSWLNVISGFPQGSVLKSLVFLIYNNDIVTDLFSKLCKFADDKK